MASQGSVTEDHRLVTSGPYALMRHPIFTALLLLLISTASLLSKRATTRGRGSVFSVKARRPRPPVALLSEWWGILGALALYLYGTEIRVRAEDGLLLRRFGSSFQEYRDNVPAYLPFLR